MNHSSDLSDLGAAQSRGDGHQDGNPSNAKAEGSSSSVSNLALLSRLKAVECPDSTYPALSPPLILHRGLGSLVYDAEGRRYIDLCAGFGALALGHNPAVHQQVLSTRCESAADSSLAPEITHGMGDVYASTAKVDLLDYLVRLLPAPLAKAALALTGAQAVEIAVKTALLATRREHFIVFSGGYHGLDLGILPLTERESFRAPFRRFMAEDRVEALPFRCSESMLEVALSRRPIAGVIVEPVQGRAGGVPATLEWLDTLRQACTRHGALLVYDEVFTGLGRSGRLTFAGTVPCDLLCLGKALGGGYPLSACVASRELMDVWPASTGEALHTGTFFGHPLSCAMALATLREINDRGLAERARALGGEALGWLRASLGASPLVRSIRGEGLMLAIEFHAAGAGAKLMDALRARGVIALASGPRGETLSITPALTIPADLLRGAIDELAACIVDLVP